MPCCRSEALPAALISNQFAMRNGNHRNKIYSSALVDSDGIRLLHLKNPGSLDLYHGSPPSGQVPSVARGPLLLTTVPVWVSAERDHHSPVYGGSVGKKAARSETRLQGESFGISGVNHRRAPIPPIFLNSGGGLPRFCPKPEVPNTGMVFSLRPLGPSRAQRSSRPHSGGHTFGGNPQRKNRESHKRNEVDGAPNPLEPHISSPYGVLRRGGGDLA